MSARGRVAGRPVLLVAGARPNFMKVAPIIRELRARSIETVLVHTGQHYDKAMSGVFFEELEIPAPGYSLEVGSGSHAVQTARIMERFEPVLLGVDPEWVVVVGDVNSTIACALVAAKEQYPVAHVEAGLRSGDLSMPEEINRLVVDRLSDVLLASSDDAVANLEREGYDSSKVALVGNVMIDTLELSLSRVTQADVLERHGLVADSFALVTLHRPSNVDDPDHLVALLETIVAGLPLHRIVWPIHPRLRNVALHIPSEIELIDPVGYIDSLALQREARMVLTDSGGIQEETTVLGTPCLTLRESTERPVTVSEGTNRVVGVRPADIAVAIADELSSRTEPRRPSLWDGRARFRVVDALYPDVQSEG